MENTKHLVTTDWIHKHKTKRGAWTKHQIEALGIEWPPRQGWIEGMDGEYINHSQARQFELGKTIRSNSSKDNAKFMKWLECQSKEELRRIKKKINELLYY